MSYDNIKSSEVKPMEETADVIGTVRNFIIENFLFGEDNGLRNDTSLLENGIIDSTGIMELVSHLEAIFGIHIEDHELIPENLDSLDNISKFLKLKI